MNVRDAATVNKINKLDYTKLVSVPQAAAIAGVHPQTIYRLIHTKVIHVYGKPKTYRVNIDEVLQDKSDLYNYRGQYKRDQLSQNVDEHRISTVHRAESSDSSPTDGCSVPIEPAGEPDASA